MDANRYATKKTIAQGMLDIALLTANASQLKYILQVGHKHEFYSLMLTLISVSIIMQVCEYHVVIILLHFTQNALPRWSFRPNLDLLIFECILSDRSVTLMLYYLWLRQVFSGFLSLSFSLLRDCRLHLVEYHNSANIINYIRTGIAFVITVLNLLISAFDSSIFKYNIIDVWIKGLCFVSKKLLFFRKDS